MQNDYNSLLLGIARALIEDSAYSARSGWKALRPDRVKPNFLLRNRV